MERAAQGGGASVRNHVDVALGDAVQCWPEQCRVSAAPVRSLCAPRRLPSAPGPASPQLLAPPPLGTASNRQRPSLPPRPLRPPIGGGRSPGAASMATRRTGTPRWPRSRAAGTPGPPAAAARRSPPWPPGSCCSCRCLPPPPPPPPVTTAYPAATRWGGRGSPGGCEGCWGAGAPSLAVPAVGSVPSRLSRAGPGRVRPRRPGCGR